MVELCQTRVSLSVRSEQLSAVWTVDYALELLLLGGLIPEAAWMALRLGDWKMAATLGLAYTNYCSAHLDMSRFVASMMVWYTVASDVFSDVFVFLKPAVERAAPSH